ncbi:unnamed protein product [Acanthoscelides obtectus]|uniref:STAS domain-containing protein n=1 Tax=Acanthoscelides obtectus TaxID=200917 RepID=A0A9P0PS60_ACAOB|nr:unnamed protein product [Acanthoscelides obtectus]CAK1634982.1 Sodium-independent sulfate anion transporter [Acanthoscelides obtectus]
MGKEANRHLLCLNAKDMLKSYIPVLIWLPQYNYGSFFQDLLAGFTVGLTEIPQGIAYAIVAGLPSHYGLYSGFMGCFIYFILGSAKDINIGPTAIMALMIQPHVGTMGPAGAVLITFLSGLIIFICGLFQLGFIVNFFSYPIIAGFTTAAALNIASSQIKSLFGIAGKSDSFLAAWVALFKHIGEARLWDTLLGCFTIIFLVIAKEIRRYGTLKRRPEWTSRRNTIGICIYLFSLASNAIAVIIASAMAYCFAQQGYQPFKLTGNVDGGLPNFTLPSFSTTYNGTYYSFTDMMENYGALVIFCPLIAILEHIAIAKAFSKGKTLNASQELIALGFSNIMSSFVQSMPVTGSFTRTAINNASGARTPACGIITGAMVLLALGFLTSTFQYIPKASLAGVIVVAMYYLCNFQAFMMMWKSKKMDLVPLTATLFFCLLINLEYGILIGIAINMTFVLYASARPKLDLEEHLPNVYMIKPKTGLYYTAAEYFREFILQNCLTEKSTVVIDGRYIGNIDSTVAKSLSTLNEELKLRDQKLLFWNFKDSVKDTCIGVNGTLSSILVDGELQEVLEKTE